LAAVTGKHVPVVVVACPFNAAVQALQPVHSLSQQTPSAMIPDAHSEVCVAVVPLVFCVAQVPTVVLQLLPVSQSACLVHTLAQPVEAHW
jgi:hypothetical protein